LLDAPASSVESTTHIVCSLSLLLNQSRWLTAAAAGLLTTQHAVCALLSWAEEKAQNARFEPDLSDRQQGWHELLAAKSMRTVRAFGKEPHELVQFKQQLKSDLRLEASQGVVWRLFGTVRELVEHCGEVMLLWLAGRMVIKGELELGGLVSFVYTASSTFDQLRMFWARHKMLAEMVIEPAARIAEILDKQPKIPLDQPPAHKMPPADSVQWKLQFSDLCFTYPGRGGAPALSQVSFVVPAGGVVGIMGPTGSGKSTLVSMLLRLYDPSSGALLLDGRPLTAYNPLWLRRQIGVVNQEPMLFDASIRQNLLYGCERPREISDAELNAAVTAAGWPAVLTDTRRFPEGLHTAVGDSGVLLSGGERQRVAIARAVLRNPKLLLLDEATSALDERTQAVVQRALESLMTDRTTVMVAHRLSTLRRAHWLVCLEEGAVCEQGTPDDLMVAGGMYAEFVQQAASSGTIEAAASQSDNDDSSS